jgi:ribosomal-protein-alanine N-acetyltransferase
MLKIRKATPSDLRAIKEIEDASFPQPWSETQIQDEIGGHLALAAEEGGIVQGYLLARQVLDTCEVLSIAVDPAKRGRGTGRRLLAETVRLAAEGGAQKMFLEVRESNQAAIRLYQKMGFQASGTRKSYYLDGENALTMEKGL